MPGCPHLRGPRAPRLRGDGRGLRRRHPPPQLLAHESAARALSSARMQLQLLSRCERLAEAMHSSLRERLSSCSDGREQVRL